ncbi:MAG: hypothetical protein EAX91_13570 [Candidatus Lokiarchaeota archaeon]|nr:hypothetical protein [Candidatus Lokiarchaeota archaeon]
MKIEKDIVYLYGFSTRKQTNLENLVNIVSEQIKNEVRIAIVFLHDGVIGTSQNGVIPSLVEKLLTFPVSIFALVPDLLARGIGPNTVDSRIQCIEYDDLVDLLVQIPKTACWM